MHSQKTNRKPKWWNNGWLWLAAILSTWALLFVIGRYSATYEPNPTIEGKRLSEWTNDIKSIGWEDWEHRSSVDVLNRHKEQVVPIFIIWLRARDTFPQEVYFFTIGLLEGKSGHLIDYRGAYFSQLAAAEALEQLKDSRQEVLAALKDVIKQYEGTGHLASRVAQETLQILEAQQAAARNGP